MKKSLYDIQEEYMVLAEKITDNDGEFTEELSIQLAINQQDLQTKGVNYAFVIKQMNDDVMIIDQEIDRLKKIKDARNKAGQKLKNMISEAMELYGIEEIKTPIMKINFRKSESVEIDKDAVIPKEYMTEKTTLSPDKTALKEAIQSGVEIMGVQIKQNKNLQIK